jgi:hypothetical protein
MERRVCWNNIKISISPALCFVYAAVCFIFGQKATAYVHAQHQQCGEIFEFLQIPQHCARSQRSSTPKIVKQKRGIPRIFGCAVKFHREMSRAHKERCLLMPHSTAHHAACVLLQKRFILFPLSLSKLKQKDASSFSRLTRSFRSSGIISSNLIVQCGRVSKSVSVNFVRPKCEGGIFV